MLRRHIPSTAKAGFRRRGERGAWGRAPWGPSYAFGGTSGTFSRPGCGGGRAAPTRRGLPVQIKSTLTQQLLDKAIEQRRLHGLDAEIGFRLPAAFDFGEQVLGQVEFWQLGRNGAISVHRAVLPRSGRIIGSKVR